MLTLQTRLEGGVAILDLDGNLDGGPETRRVQDLVKELLGEGQRRIVLNLSGVPWANSLGVGVLIAAFASARREEASLKFVGLSDRVEMVMRALRLIPDVFETYADEAEAMRSFPSAQEPAV